MNNAPYGETIGNATRRTDMHLLNEMEKARLLVKKPHCVKFRVFDGQVAEASKKSCGAKTGGVGMDCNAEGQSLYQQAFCKFHFRAGVQQAQNE